ncbi:MAG: AraC family transcriptional regulator [Candidatus Thiodiazotropha endolucinida]
MNNQIPDDALTRLLDRMQIEAQLFKHRDYCGSWAIDTSGSGLVPFHLIERGMGWLHIEGQPPQHLQAGDFVLFPRDLPHVVTSEATPPNPDIINLEESGTKDENFASILCGFYVFRSRAVTPLLNDLPQLVLIKDAHDNTSTAAIGFVIDAALVELDHDYPGRNTALRDLARLLFLNVLRDRIARGLSEHFLAALGDPQIGRALTAIHTDFSRSLSLDVLARLAGMSRSSFSDKFHTLIGVTPAKYVTNWRMQEAVVLLETTDLSVEQIADACGYNSHIAFRKAFKSITGTTPRQARMGNTRKYA